MLLPSCRIHPQLTTRPPPTQRHYGPVVVKRVLPTAQNNLCWHILHEELEKNEDVLINFIHDQKCRYNMMLIHVITVWNSCLSSSCCPTLSLWRHITNSVYQRRPKCITCGCIWLHPIWAISHTLEDADQSELVCWLKAGQLELWKVIVQHSVQTASSKLCCCMLRLTLLPAISSTVNK